MSEGGRAEVHLPKPPVVEYITENAPSRARTPEKSRNQVPTTQIRAQCIEQCD